MDKISGLTVSQRRSIAVATFVSIVFGAWFLRSFFILIVFAAVLAYLFSPLYRRLMGWKMSKGGASATTLLISMFMVLIPLVLIALLATTQLRSFVDNIAVFIQTFDINEANGKLVEFINNLLGLLPFGDFTVSQETLANAVQEALLGLGSFLVNSLTGLATSVPSLVTNSIIYIYVFLSILKNGPKLIETFRQLNPLGPKVSDLYLIKAGAMVRGTVQGQFIIAAVQGLFSAIAFAVIGYSELFFVLFILFTVMSIIPLGAGILIIPLGFIMALTGNISGGAVVILEHILINSNIDNVLRPILVPREARLDSALMLVSVFAGMRIFGFAGIILGPTIMVLLVTTVQIYLDVYKNYSMDGNSGSKARNKSWEKITDWFSNK